MNGTEVDYRDAPEVLAQGYRVACSVDWWFCQEIMLHEGELWYKSRRGQPTRRVTNPDLHTFWRIEDDEQQTENTGRNRN